MSLRRNGGGMVAAILGFGSGLVILLWAAVLLKVSSEHEADLRDAFKHSANLARAAEEHAVRTLREADQVLLFLRHQYGQSGRKLDVRALLQDGPVLSKFYSALGIIDERGDLVLNSRPFQPINLADRDYFRAHADGDGSDLPFIGSPVTSRLSGESVVQLSRRIAKPDGSFGGVAALAINPDYFSVFYGQLDVGARGMTTLVGRDRVVRAQRAGSRLGAVTPDARNWAVFKHLETAESGDYISASAVDGERRIFTFRALKEYPLVVVIGVLEREVLADFFERRRNYYLGAALISAVIIAMTALLVAMSARQSRMARDLERQNAELAGAERRFEALFHNSLVPQAVSNPQSRVAEDANQAFRDLTGYSHEQIAAQTGSEFGLYWDAGELEKVSRIIRQKGTAEPVEVRLRRADGQQRITLVTAASIESESGPRIAWSLIDVTEQRESQRTIREMNQDLERTVARRTAELQRANDELKSALEVLKSSQDALVRAEKLAALGRLVAGVAHELNTPIGNGLLSATTLHEHTEAFAMEAASGGLRRSALEAFVAQSREASGILVRNLGKAAELISSFKQVAADQTSSQRRGFSLDEVVNEVLLAHRPMLKTSPIRIVLDVPAGIRMDSYPGPLGQVLGNLITNAVLHGYEGRAGGTVTVSARLDGEAMVEIAVLDQGRGIGEADLKRIFDPFFTTKLGRGGTGLGLGICHNIVTDTLGGTMSVTSRPDEGSCFTLRIPLAAPTGLDKREAA